MSTFKSPLIIDVKEIGSSKKFLDLNAAELAPLSLLERARFLCKLYLHEMRSVEGLSDPTVIKTIKHKTTRHFCMSDKTLPSKPALTRICEQNGI